MVKDKDNNSQQNTKETGKANEGVQIKVAGPSFLPPFGKRPYVKPESQDQLDDVKRQETEISDKINPAIVEGIPGKALTAEDTDPETKCQNTCGQHEICQINHDGILCKCRPGYGRNSKTDSLCEKSLSYQIEVLTTSESREEITVVRLSPRRLRQVCERPCGRTSK